MSALLITSDLGAGACGAGSSLAGFGDPATTAANTAKIYIKLDGTQGDAALIDHKTGDYVLDQYGNKVGDDSANQLVYLALFTKRGSSIIQDLGLDLINATITDDTVDIAKAAVKLALQDLTNKNIIELMTINVIVNQDKVSVNIVYRILSNNQVKTFTLNG